MYTIQPATLLCMTDKTFNACVTTIRGLVDLYMETGSIEFQKTTKPVWEYLHAEGRAQQAANILDQECLAEIQAAILGLA